MRGAAYMQALQQLKRACDRELDDIQAGGAPTPDVGTAFSAVTKERMALQEQIRRTPGRQSPNVT